LLEIKSTEDKAERVQLSEAEWERRYQLEKEIQEIFVTEEMYWQKQGGEKWILKGDSNTSFHKCANGRKRKSTISSLEDEDGVTTDFEELKKHIMEYYKMLFGREETAEIHLRDEIWDSSQRVTEEENER